VYKQVCKIHVSGDLVIGYETIEPAGKIYYCYYYYLLRSFYAECLNYVPVTNHVPRA
jgi:hypothetical protein